MVRPDEQYSEGGEGSSGSLEGRLLERFASSRPPEAKLTRDEQRALAQLNKRSDFRKLKDAVRLAAWARSAPLLNQDARQADFAVTFSFEQGFRSGILEAINMLENFLEPSDDGEE
jgi:hypothetical protein